MGDLELTKNYRGITFTSIAAKIYHALLWNRREPKIDNILRKNQNGFRRNRSTTSQILTIRRILEGVRTKKLQATLFVDFTKAFDSIYRGKMEQILRSIKRNRRSHNDSLQKHQSESAFPSMNYLFKLDITSSSATFTWFVLLSHQKFNERPLFKHVVLPLIFCYFE